LAALGLGANARILRWHDQVLDALDRLALHCQELILAAHAAAILRVVIIEQDLAVLMECILFVLHLLPRMA